eukprot:scaffold24726_cov18-Tisochrysis_lutea.AAC.1
MATMAPQEKNGGSVPRFLSLIPEMQAEAQNTTKGALNPNEFKPFKVIGEARVQASKVEMLNMRMVVNGRELFSLSAHIAPVSINKSKRNNS